MAQILGQISRYYPSSDFDPFKYEEQHRGSYSRESSSDRLRDFTESSGASNVPLRSDRRSGNRPPGRRKKRGKPTSRQQHLSADMSTFGTATRPDISELFDGDNCIWAHHCCAAWSAGVCQTDSYDLENVDKAAYKAIGEVIYTIFIPQFFVIIGSWVTCMHYSWFNSVHFFLNLPLFL